MKKLLLPFVMILLLWGCEKETPEVKFEELTIDYVSEKDCNPEEENCAFISMSIPWAINNGRRNKEINRHIEQHVITLVDFQEENSFGSLESLSQNFINQYEATAEEFPEYNIPWEASVQGRIVNRSPEVISIEFLLNLFTGGAHGYTSVSYLNLNSETGEKYSHEELFEEDFKAYAESLFRKENDIPEDEPINSTGYFFDNDSFQLPQNIGILKNKIILRYNAYEVASYSEGGIKIEIPREEVNKFMKID